MERLGAQGMQGWRKFTFFDADNPTAAQPNAVAACGLQSATCTASQGTWAAFGKSDGTVVLLDTTAHGVAAFRAHPTGVLHMVVLQVGALLRFGSETAIRFADTVYHSAAAAGDEVALLDCRQTTFPWTAE